MHNWLLKKLHHFVIRSEAKPTQLSLSHTRFFVIHVSYTVHVFALNFLWLTAFPVSFVLNKSAYVGFGFMTLNSPFHG